MKSDEPAWYSVGDGRLRLWDGAQWTDRYRLADAPKRQTPQRHTVGQPTPRRQKAPPRDAPVRREDDERLDTLVATGHGSRFVTWALLVAAAVVATVVGFSYFTG